MPPSVEDMYGQQENSFVNKVIISILKVIGTFMSVSICSCSSMNKSQNQNKDKEANSVINNNSLNDKTPFLTAPKVTKIWIPEKIENEKFIEGHWMWVIERGTNWSR